MESKYIDIAKERLAQYNLAIGDLTNEELAELIGEIKDDELHPDEVRFDGFLETESLNLSLRKAIIECGESVPDSLKNLASE